MKFLRSKLTLFFASLFVFSAAYAAYYGFDPNTGLETMHGTLVDGSASAPTIAQTGQTISAQLGSTNAGTWVATGATTGAGTLTFAVAAPNGRACNFKDLTTPADALNQTSATDGKTVVTVAGTIVSADKFAYVCFAY